MNQSIETESSTRRVRYAKVDFERLGTPAAPAATVQLNLFDDTVLNAVFERQESNELGSFAWIGRIEDVAYSHAFLVVTNGVLAGSVMMPGGQYEVSHAGDGVYALRAVDQSTFPPELEPIHLPRDAVQMALEPAVQTAEVDDPCNEIRILIAYTPEARMAAGGVDEIESLIALSVTQTNQAYVNSSMNSRLVLVHMVETTPGDSNNDFGADLTALRVQDDGIFDELDAARETYLADEVGLIIESTSSCGLAYVNSVATSAFSVTARACASANLTLAHEVGHNLSNRHDWYVDDCLADAANPLREGCPYNKGYVYLADDWRTIMAYQNLCLAQSPRQFCSKLPYFSNPNVTNDNGVPVGVDEDGPSDCVAGQASPDPASCAANNALATNNYCSRVANFRQGKPAGSRTLNVRSVNAANLNIASSTGHRGLTNYNKTVPAGTQVRLTAPLNPGLKKFRNWTGCDSVAGNGNSTCTVTVNTAKTVTATYDDICRYTVMQPNGGQVWTRGNSYSVNWSRQGKDCGGLARLQLYKGGAFNRTISAGTNDTTFPWTIPAGQATGSDYKVKVTDTTKPKYTDFSNGNFTIKSAIVPPTGVTASDGTYMDRVEVKWSAVAGAASYIVSRCTAANSGCVKAGTVKSTTFNDRDGMIDVVYFYKVRACASGSCTAFSKADQGHRASVIDEDRPMAVYRLPSFDNDGKSDVMLRHMTDGKWQINFMNFRQVKANSGPTSLITNLDWEWKGHGDFNGNGRGDVLVRNRKTLTWLIYLMNGRSRTSGPVALFKVEDWDVAGIHDFDGDGNDDVLLRHRVSGRWYISFLNGRTVRANSGFTSLLTNLDWEMMGTGDFDGNGRGDVLLRNRKTGKWWMFLMNGRNKVGGETMITADQDWVIAAIDDFDGDGKDDVLLRNRKTGRWLINFMKFRQVQAKSGQTPIFTNQVWEIMATGDFNLSGRGDVLLRNKSTGVWWMFLMNGRSQVNGKTLITTDMQWKIPYRIEDDSP